MVHSGEPDLALGIIQHLGRSGFDVSSSKRLPPGYHDDRSVPHAYGFIYTRLLHDRVQPSIPLFINTFYPPNQPSLERCYIFGKILAEAILAWPEDKSVGVIASGGLTHFVVEEDLDQQFLEWLRSGSEEQLVGFPVERFNSGTSEIRNWIALAGCLSRTDLRLEFLDYVPCYRSLAGTGSAMGFAYWR
jgi:hypothetical protein